MSELPPILLEPRRGRNAIIDQSRQPCRTTARRHECCCETCRVESSRWKNGGPPMKQKSQAPVSNLHLTDMKVDIMSAIQALGEHIDRLLQPRA